MVRQLGRLQVFLLADVTVEDAALLAVLRGKKDGFRTGVV